MDAATLVDYDGPARNDTQQGDRHTILQQDSGKAEEYDWVTCTRLKSPYNSSMYVAFRQAHEQAINDQHTPLATNWGLSTLFEINPAVFLPHKTDR